MSVINRLDGFLEGDSVKIEKKAVPVSTFVLIIQVLLEIISFSFENNGILTFENQV